MADCNVEKLCFPNAGGFAYRSKRNKQSCMEVISGAGRKKQGGDLKEDEGGNFAERFA